MNRIRLINRLLPVILLMAGLLAGCKDPSGTRVYSSPSGIYSCQESSAYSGYRKYLVEIDSTQLGDGMYIISNFHNQGDLEFIYARVANDSIFITGQAISNLRINGKGKVSSDFKAITIEYQTSDGLIDLDYFAVYSR